MDKRNFRFRHNAKGFILRIAKTFTSIQGEGALTGTPMFFVRLSGCSVVQCPLHPATSSLCDTNWAFSHETDVDELSEQSMETGLTWICITGGEPTDQLGEVLKLVSACNRNGQKVMLQTSGVKSVPDVFDWVVVSPKEHFLQLKQRRGHELKLVWNGQDFAHLKAMSIQTHFLHYFLQPLFNHDSTTNLEDVIRVVQGCGRLGMPYRLSCQQHKTWGIE